MMCSSVQLAITLQNWCFSWWSVNTSVWWWSFCNRAQFNPT